MFQIAEKFGKLVHELGDLTTADLAEYLAYFKIKREEEAKALKKNAANKPPVGGRRRR
jgi:hypothetical protein